MDTWTGYTKLLDHLAIHDIVQPINTDMCISQIQGTVQIGTDAALREHLAVGPDGRTADSLSKYHLFLALDLPPIWVELLTDTNEGYSEGECGTCTVPRERACTLA